MRGKFLAVFVSLFVLGVGSGQAQEAVLAIQDTCGSPGETVILNVYLDNSEVGDVAAAQMDILFNTDVFTVTNIAKTPRSESIDLFLFNEKPGEGVTFVLTGIGHQIDPGTGSVGEITVEIDAGAADGSYDWTLSEVILSDPMGTPYAFTTEDGTFQIPCGGPSEGAILALEDTGANPGEQGVIHVTLDNSTVGEVAAGEMVITFDKDVFTIDDIVKTSRSEEIDLFLFNDHAEGVSFVFTGIGHSIAPGTGPIADIEFTVDAGAAQTLYNWCFLPGTIVADPLGNELPHTTVCLDFKVSVEPVHLDVVPTQYDLSQNYPNPFNPTTTLELSLPVSVHVRAEVYNVVGQRIRELVNSELPTGYYTLNWDGLNDHGQTVTSGVYFVRLRAGEFTKSVKMLLLK